jgi:hypothetical protein
MHTRFTHSQIFVAVALLIGSAACGFAQAQQYRPERPANPAISRPRIDNPHPAAAGQYYGYQNGAPSNWGTYPISVSPTIQPIQTQSQQSYAEYQEQQRRRAAQAAAIRAQMGETQAHADPEAPDQSELLRNSKDHDFILRNFHTMYVDARNAQYFGSDQMKAALGRNKEFQKLKIRIVDDPRVADVVLKVSYTFAWDYPFELRHQNTTYVLLAGKGEGPFSGPLGAADVARQFVKAAKPWREMKKAEAK